MSIKKRQDGRYQKKVNIARKGEPTRYKYIYGTTIREVETKKQELLAQVNQGIDLENNPTVNHAIDRWLEDREARVRPQTLDNYRRALRLVRDRMGGRLVRDVTLTDARRLYRDLAKDTPVQAARVVKFMTSVFRDEVNRGIIIRNPWATVNTAKHDPPVKRILTDAELEAIEKAPLDRRERAIISTLRFTGVRKGELFGLHVDDVDLVLGELHIRRTTTTRRTVNDPKTKAGKRTIPMPKRLCDDLGAYLEQHTGEGILFPNCHGGYAIDSAVYKPWWAIARKIFNGHPPDDFTPHLFRHSYAHDLVANNVPVLTAMLVLGHDDMKTTLRTYSHFGYKEADTDSVLHAFDAGVKTGVKRDGNGADASPRL